MTNQSNKDINVDFALNNLSFGQVSVAILREMYKRGMTPNIFPLQGQVDIGSQVPDERFNQWLGHCINKAPREYSRKARTVKLWHISQSYGSYSEEGNDLITFYECNDPTSTEINVLKNQRRVYVTNKYTQGILKTFGVDAQYLPLGFDSHNFKVLEKRPGVDGVITTLLLAKLEHRKHTLRQLALWAKRYGNQKEYRLNAAIFNPFVKPEVQQAMIAQALEGKSFWNITFLNHMPTNAEYNQYLQSGQIVLACSGSEGFGLGEYHAAAMGAWPVALAAHAYRDHFDSTNAVMIQPNGMTPVYDNIHFAQGQPYNQGSIFTFGDEDWYAGMEEATKRAKNGLNIQGYSLQQKNYKQTLDILLRE